MAWPFTRLLDFLPNSVPRIGAACLNSLQDYIGHLFAGTKTLKSLHVDGVGDQTSTAAAGDVLISGSVRPQKSAYASSLPTPTIANDEHTRGGIRTSSFTISIPGDPASFTGGETVYSITRTGTGSYEIVHDFVVGVNPNTIYCDVNWHASGNTATVITTDSGGPGGRFRTTIGIMNSALNLVDQAGRFTVIVCPR